MHLLQRQAFQACYSSLSHPYVCAYRHPVSGHWILCFTMQANFWFLGAQRGGLRQFRTLDTLQKYVTDSLGCADLSVHDAYPDRFPAHFHDA